MKNAEIIFRADGSTETGLGHIVRSVSLANMVASLGTVTLITQSDDDFTARLTSAYKINQLTFSGGRFEEDFFRYVSAIAEKRRVIVVLDGYDFDQAYQIRLKSSGIKLVMIDDLQTLGYACDAIINPAEIDSTEYYPAGIPVFSGKNYTLLRPLFLEAASKPKTFREFQGKLFVSFGASDPGNKTLELLEAFKDSAEIEVINVLTSELNPHLASLTAFAATATPSIQFHQNLDEAGLFKLISDCDGCITSASTIASEVISIGKPLICAITAENQQALYESLVKNGVCTGAGDLSGTMAVDWKILTETFRNVAAVKEQLTQQHHYLDGLSAERYIHLFQDLLA